MHISIRQSGGANIVSIPKVILKALNLHPGSTLELSVEDHKIVLTPTDNEMTLEALLAGSPKARLQRTEEDQEWHDEMPRGGEL